MHVCSYRFPYTSLYHPSLSLFLCFCLSLSIAPESCSLFFSHSRNVASENSENGNNSSAMQIMTRARSGNCVFTKEELKVMARSRRKKTLAKMSKYISGISVPRVKNSFRVTRALIKRKLKVNKLFPTI